MKPIEKSDDALACERKLADYLSRRDHSERELRTKLSRRFTLETVSQTIQKAQDRGWLASPEKLATQTADRLRRRGKGIRYIQQYLKLKGLPAVAQAPENESEQAAKLVERKFKWPRPWTREQQAKVGRFLYSRGYTEAIIRKVLYSEES